MLNDEEKHIRSVGKLIGNLQSLEFLLRGFLATIYDSDSNGLIPGMPKDMYGLQVGDTVPINHMTNWDSLAQLIEKYNDYVKQRDVSLLIDTQVIDIRDALAHGRVSGPSLSSPLKILKFDKPTNKQTRVVFSQIMDDFWFKSKINLVLGEIFKTYRACKLFAPRMIV